MENASKALLIAGAILLVIAIIAIGMTIYNQSAKVVTDTGAQIDGMSISTHNAQFDGLVIGEFISGRDYKELVTKMISYNKSASKNLRVDYSQAVFGNTEAGSGAGWDTIPLGGIKNNEEYEVLDIRYHDGIISGVSIEFPVAAASN